MTPTTKILVLYTELAPYVLACFKAAVARDGVEFHVVRWPVNQEAPFELEQGQGITLYDRHRFDTRALLKFAEELTPSLVLTSGWVDKGYLAVCRRLNARRIPTVMTFDTAWTGSWKQWISAIAARFWVPFTFSHAWATGQRQMVYARLLGFLPFRIRTGFYAADTAMFAPLGERLLAERTSLWPHRFLCVARYIPSKGQQLLCEAFAALCDAGHAGDWQLTLVGTGEQFEAVTSSVAGRHPRIEHLGFRQAHELEEVIARSGAFVLPSLYEPWGVVVQEQACSGLPLVLSDAVGASERFLGPGSNGYAFKAGNRADLQKALRSIIERSDDELLRMGRQSAVLGTAWSPEAWARLLNELVSER